MEKFVIKRLGNLSIHDIQPLLKESREEGFEFVDRLVKEYNNGVNQFKKKGEALFAVYKIQQLVGIGGLNIDPYAGESHIARVRHLYVLSSWRRQGIGKLLIQTIINEAQHHFRLLTLRTFKEEANKFYCSIGFQTKPAIKNTTHHMVLSEYKAKIGNKDK